MNAEEVVILVADDDSGHAALMKKSLRRSGFKNNSLHFKDGKEILNFLFQKGNGQHLVPDTTYLLLLDIRMPVVDGVEVLRQIKQDRELCKMPVVMLTTIENPIEVEECNKLGCRIYLTKPVSFRKFIESISKLGLFLKVIQLPNPNESKEKRRARL